MSGSDLYQTEKRTKCTHIRQNPLLSSCIRNCPMSSIIHLFCAKRRKKPDMNGHSHPVFGRGDRIWTCDLLVPKDLVVVHFCPHMSANAGIWEHRIRLKRDNSCCSLVAGLPPVQAKFLLQSYMVQKSITNCWRCNRLFSHWLLHDLHFKVDWSPKWFREYFFKIRFLSFQQHH